MVQTCCVTHCTNRRSKESSVTFHSFPARDHERMKEWLRRINRTDASGNPWQPSKFMKVCSSHFLPTDFWTEDGYKLRVLNDTAVPSIFPPGPKPKKSELKGIKSKVQPRVKKSQDQPASDKSQGQSPTKRSQAQPATETIKRSQRQLNNSLCQAVAKKSKGRPLAKKSLGQPAVRKSPGQSPKNKSQGWATGKKSQGQPAVKKSTLKVKLPKRTTQKKISKRSSPDDHTFPAKRLKIEDSACSSSVEVVEDECDKSQDDLKMAQNTIEEMAKVIQELQRKLKQQENH